MFGSGYSNKGNAFGVGGAPGAQGQGQGLTTAPGQQKRTVQPAPDPMGGAQRPSGPPMPKAMPAPAQGVPASPMAGRPMTPGMPQGMSPMPAAMLQRPMAPAGSSPMAGGLPPAARPPANPMGQGLGQNPLFSFLFGGS